jgi:selenide,water dikinase
MDQKDIKLTEFSHGAGCGCKIAPAVLEEILSVPGKAAPFQQLLVGNDTRDDAAVMDLGDGTGIISTTDFFMPIVDDPEDFGDIAAVNALSDIYAMGGTPLMAIAILGWPVGKLSNELAGRVVAGGRRACERAGIPLAGGHSIDSPEPIFGLAVTGRVPLKNLKRNGGAQPGDGLYLTKPLGVGILSTAQKQQKIAPEHLAMAVESMTTLNQLGTLLGTMEGVTALTDVTGFGLLGHLGEMCQASGTSAVLREKDIPLLNAGVLNHYLELGCIPGGTKRNWASYGSTVQPLTDRQKWLLADPQTSGGLLISVRPSDAPLVEALLQQHDAHHRSIGAMESRGNYLIRLAE